MPQALTIRPFGWGDIPAITEIYRHYVETSTATLELTAPQETAMAERLGAMRAQAHPLLCAELDGALVGYAYASFYRPRLGYRFTCEDSIYIRPDAAGQGFGTLLMRQLLEQAKALGFRQTLAVISAESLPSIHLHKNLGFRQVGTYEAVGFKFDRWIDTVHLQKTL